MRHWHALVLTSLAVFASGGCNDPVAPPPVVKPVKAEPKTPAPPWGIDPAPANKFSRTGRISHFEFPVPNELREMNDIQLPVQSRIVAWDESGDPDTMLVASVWGGADMLEASNDMTEVLSVFSGTMGTVFRNEIEDYGTPESHELAGTKFTRLPWTGRTSDGQPSKGAAYGAFDGERVVLFVLSANGDDAAKRLKRMEASVVSLKESR